MKVYTIRISNDDRYAYEFYNSGTVPVLFMNGKLQSCLEGGYPVPNENDAWVKIRIMTYDPAQEDIHPKYMHELDVNDSKVHFVVNLSEADGEPSQVPDITLASVFSFTMKEPKGGFIGLVVQTYMKIKSPVEESTLDQLIPVGDTSFSLKEMDVHSIGKPIFSRAAIRAMEYETDTSFSIERYKGHGMIYLFSGNDHSGVLKSVFDGHPIEKLLDIHECLLTEQEEVILAPKTELAAAYGRITTSSPNNNDAHAAEYKEKPLHPLQPLYPIQWPVHTLPPVYTIPQQASKRVASHLAKQRTWFLRAESFYYFKGVRAASAEWFEARVLEVLAVRGIRPDTFLEMVSEMKDATEPTQTFQECLKIAALVLKIHSSTRPYVNDFTVIPDVKEDEIIQYDEETGGIALPRDCEDGDWTVNAFHFTILFSGVHENNKLVSAFRSCAAVLGVPCATFGSFSDPTVRYDDARAGHTFAVAIPFGVFALQIGTTPPTKEFRAEFGFDLPLFHTKPANLDSVSMMSTFYGDHRQVNEFKQKKFEILLQQILDYDSAHSAFGWYWSKYTCQFPMNKQYHGQQHAFRLITDIFACMPSWSPGPVYISHANKIYDKVNHAEFIPRSFLVCSNLDEHSTIKACNRVYPHAKNGLKQDENAYIAFQEKFKQCGGVGKMGVSIEMFMSPRLFNGAPVTRLVAIRANKGCADVENLVRSEYSRPIVTLRQPITPDNFFAGAVRPRVVYSDTVTLPPRDTNSQIKMFAYWRSTKELNVVCNDIMNALEAKRFWLYPYGFMTAVVFEF